MVDGSQKNIEDVKAGEAVLSFDPQTKEIIQSVVLEPYSVVRDHYYVITTESGKEIKVTDEHPIFVGFDPEPAKIKEITRWQEVAP